MEYAKTDLTILHSQILSNEAAMFIVDCTIRADWDVITKILVTLYT